MIRKLGTILVLLIVFASTGRAEPPPILEAEPIRASSIRDWILHLESMPCGKEFAGCDPRLWQVVRLGYEHIPTILELVDDATETEMTVCLFGENYAVGDVARFAFENIVQRAPTAQFAAGDDEKAIDTIGFGVYWRFVRESQENRDAMKTFLQDWFAENKSHLKWVRLREHPAGGYYEAVNH